MLLMGGAGDLQEVFMFDCILVWNLFQHDITTKMILQCY